METRNRRLEIRNGLLEMSSEKKTEWILEAVADIEKLEEELKVYRRKVVKLYEKIKKLEDENKSLIVEAATDIKNLEDENESLIVEYAVDIKKLEDENKRLKAQLEMNQDVTQPGDDVFIPRSYSGIPSNLKKTTKDWSKTLPEVYNLVPPRRIFTKDSPQGPTPPRRKTDKGGKRGKNIKTMRKYSKK